MLPASRAAGLAVLCVPGGIYARRSRPRRVILCGRCASWLASSAFCVRWLGSLAAARSRVRGRSGLVSVPLRLHDSETVASDLFASVVQALDLSQLCGSGCRGHSTSNRSHFVSIRPLRELIERTEAKTASIRSRLTRSSIALPAASANTAARDADASAPWHHPNKSARRRTSTPSRASPPAPAPLHYCTRSTS